MCGGIGGTAFPSGALASASAFRVLASLIRRSREFKEGTTERSDSIVSNSDYSTGLANTFAQKICEERPKGETTLQTCPNLPVKSFQKLSRVSGL